ncbi:MAG: CDP-alcohol phosphatidyltransferase family protein [Pseudomonadota bacterium]
MIWTIPNVLTMGRLLAAPALALPFMLLDRPVADWVALGIFVCAALTDWLDGWLARRLGQESRLGQVLDPIADKAAVVVALSVLLALSSLAAGPPLQVAATEGRVISARLDPMIAVPIMAILFREILVSGLREALGPQAKLAVTRLAKIKTTVQMVAIAVLFAARPVAETLVLSPRPVAYVDYAGFATWYAHLQTLGLVLLWIAAVLTTITGWDYAAKALRYIREREEQ